MWKPRRSSILLFLFVVSSAVSPFSGTFAVFTPKSTAVLSSSSSSISFIELSTKLAHMQIRMTGGNISGFSFNQTQRTQDKGEGSSAEDSGTEGADLYCENIDKDHEKQVVLVTAVDPLPESGEKIRENHRQYAIQHHLAYCFLSGANFLANDSATGPPRLLHWVRYPLVSYLLPHFRWAVWFDFDMLFLHYNDSLEEKFIKPYEAKNMSVVLTGDCCVVMNSCLFAVKNDLIALQYLRSIYYFFPPPVYQKDNKAMILYSEQFPNVVKKWPELGEYGIIVPYNDWQTMPCIHQWGNPGLQVIDPEPGALFWHWAGVPSKWELLGIFLDIYQKNLTTTLPKEMKCRYGRLINGKLVTLD